jgi:hypothetical protein
MAFSEFVRIPSLILEAFKKRSSRRVHFFGLGRRLASFVPVPTRHDVREGHAGSGLKKPNPEIEVLTYAKARIECAHRLDGIPPRE